jgi:hypothetical protein
MLTEFLPASGGAERSDSAQQLRKCRAITKKNDESQYFLNLAKL